MSPKRIVKCIKTIALTGILLLSVGCTENSTKTTKTTESEGVLNIRAFLQEKYNGPNDELIKIWNLSPEKYDEEKLKEYHKKIRAYREEHIKPYVSEQIYREYGRYRILKEATFYNYKLKVEDITIEESESTKNSYNFNVKIAYSRDGRDDRGTINLRGLMNTNEDGKITRIIHHNFRELERAIGRHSNGSLVYLRDFLQEEFNGPSKELKKIFKTVKSKDDEENQKGYDELHNYYDEHLKQYISAEINEDYLNNRAYKFLELAASNGYKLQTENIDVDRSKTTRHSFNFVVDVAYTKDGDDESKTIELRGLTNTDEDAEIIRIIYHNSSELVNALKN